MGPKAVAPPVPPSLRRYDADVLERFCIMTMDGGLSDVKAAGELYRAGWITRRDYLEVRNNADV